MQACARSGLSTFKTLIRTHGKNSSVYYRSLCTGADASSIASKNEAPLAPRKDDTPVDVPVVVSPQLEAKLAKMRSAMASARDAIAVASAVDSDDRERDKATSCSRYAIRSYDELVKSTSQSEVKAVEVLEPDMQALKAELYQARWQRIWIGWHGWF